MEELHKIFQENILESMSEGIMVVGFDGVMRYANPSALELLGFEEKELMGKTFASLFFNDPENDDFSQVVIDAITDRNNEHKAVVIYRRGKDTLHLHVRSSFLVDTKERKGIIVVISDLSELTETRDAFGRFLSDDIVKQLLDTPDGLKLGGKKQTLTIMMSDLRGFTAMSERMDATDLISMLNHYLGEMTEVIQARKGTIIEFIGDGILAIFGAPEETPDHATNAVAAALEMQDRMESINKWNSERGYPVLEMGIGLNTGEVIVGNIGSEKRTKYGVVGSQVNLCGRIESYTVGGQILISQSTCDLVNSELEVSKMMTVYPKGARGELVLSHITGIGEPYNIHVHMIESVLQQLENPIAVSFRKLEGKHEIKKSMYGGLTAVARDAAFMETEAELEVYDNILINAGGKLFCKITDKTDKGYELQYTSVPTGYAGWLKDARSS
ncbi:MAG: PAS domain S-box protein [Lachnospiraceae bacterium]|nr:PAS domain S-box protein [Lachnospiraceae bacterium]